MRNFKFLALAAIAITLFASCMGENYAAPQGSESPYGNNALTESNVLTVAQLKEKFASAFATNKAFKEITEDIQVKGVVTSSDKEGNIYQEVVLQDATGAISVLVAQSNTYGYLPLGAEVLVSLKGLCVGNYKFQPQIGALGSGSLGKINKFVWNEHFKILSNNNKVEPKVFDGSWNLDADAGKLGVIKNVSLKSGYDFNAKVNVTTYANANGGAGSVSWSLNEQDSKTLVMYNSNFAKFASLPVPVGKKVNITGIFKRYNNLWEIIIRSIDDVEEVKAPLDPLAGLKGTGKGTAADPMDVTRALALINSGNAGTTEWYVKGKISTLAASGFNAKYHNYTYSISQDGTTNNELEVFRGKYLKGADFTSADQLLLGKTVVVAGKLKNYNGTLEFNAGSKLISIN